MKKDHINPILSVILIDSLCKIGKKYYLQVFWEEWKRTEYDSDDSDNLDAQYTMIILLSIKNMTLVKM